MDIQPGVGEIVRPCGVHLPECRRQRGKIRIPAAFRVHPSLQRGAQGAGAAMLADLVKIVTRVLGQHRQHLRLPGRGAQDHAAVGVQAPAPAGPVCERRHPFPPQPLHKAPQGPVDASAGGLEQGRLFQARTPENIRLPPPQQRLLQRGLRRGVGLNDLPHQTHGQPLNNVRLLTGEGAGMLVAQQMLPGALRLLQGLAGLRTDNVKLGLQHTGRIAPAVALQLAEDMLHPLQGRHSVVINQPQGPKTANLVDDVRLRLEVQRNHPPQLPISGSSRQLLHLSPPRCMSAPPEGPAGRSHPGRSSRRWPRSPHP